MEFYYVWKKSKNYALWKQNYKHVFGVFYRYTSYAVCDVLLAHLSHWCRLRNVLGVAIRQRLEGRRCRDPKKG